MTPRGDVSSWRGWPDPASRFLQRLGVDIDAKLLQPHERQYGDQARQRLQQQLARDRRPPRLERCAVGSVAVLTSQLGRTFVLSDLEASLMHDRSLRKHLDWLRFGMILCDAHARVHWLNGSAKRLLAGGPLRLVASRLLGRSPADTAKLMNELAQAEAAAGNNVRYLRLGDGGWGLQVAMQAASQSSTMVLTLTAASRGIDIPTDALIQLFGLTPTESRLVQALVAGRSVEQYAEDRGVSVGTARVQLKHIQAKTGAKRQSDLVRLVLSSAAAHLLSGHTEPAESSKDPGHA